MRSQPRLERTPRSSSRSFGATGTTSFTATDLDARKRCAVVDRPRHPAEAPTVRDTIDVEFGAVANQAATHQPGASDRVSRNGAVHAGPADLIGTAFDIVVRSDLTDPGRAPLRVRQPMIGTADPVPPTRLVPAIVVRSTVNEPARATVPSVTGNPVSRHHAAGVARRHLPDPPSTRHHHAQH